MSGFLTRFLRNNRNQIASGSSRFGPKPTENSNDSHHKLDHQVFADMLLQPWETKTPKTARQGDDKALILAKGLTPAVERILRSEVTAEKSPSSVFTYAACLKAV